MKFIFNSNFFFCFSRAGSAITTMIVVMVPMKANSAMLNTKPVQQMNLHVKISNVFVIYIVVTVKMIVVIIPMKLAAKKTIIHVQLDNFLVQMVNALIII